MAHDFPGDSIPTSQNQSYVKSGNRRVVDVEQDFENLPEYGDRNAVVFPQAFKEGYYDDLLHNHLQGIQRLDDGEFFVYSGGVKDLKIGNLIFIKYTCPHHHPTNSKTLLKGPVASNMWEGVQSLTINPECHIYKLTDGDYWHVGGISSMGDVLVAAVEDENDPQAKSRILFINVEDPYSPYVYEKHIDRDPDHKCGAATAIKLSDGRILCACWTDSGDPFNDSSKVHRMDFYISQDQHVNSDYTHVKRIFYKDITNRKSHSGRGSYRYPAFQSIQFIQQENGEIYLIGMFNTSSIGGGKNKAYLFKVELDNSPEIVQDVTYIKDHEFFSDSRFYNMAAGGCVYVNSYKELTLYGTPYRIRNRREISFAEFCVPMKKPLPKITDRSHSRIELYSDPNYKGPYLKIIGDKYTAIPDFNDYQYGGKRLDNAVSSTRFIIPENDKYLLHNRPFWTRRSNDKIYKLVGTGEVVEKNQFPPTYDSIASSSKYE